MLPPGPPAARRVSNRDTGKFFNKSLNRMDPDNDPQARSNARTVDGARRAFLRQSIYAAYATPLITALLVEEAGAASSNCPPGVKEKCATGQISGPVCDRCG
jgi:hypothetical protein